MSFTDEETAYLTSNPLARFASLCAGGQPDVVPVALEFDGTHFWVGGPRAEVLDTRKFRNVGHGRDKVAFVVDDLISVEPFVARGIRVYGVAAAPSSGSAWWAPATICASRRRCRGAGTCRTRRSLPVTPGTPCGGRSTLTAHRLRDPRHIQARHNGPTPSVIAV